MKITDVVKLVEAAAYGVLGLSERGVNQNASSYLDRGSERSSALSTTLRQAYAKFPQAQSDMEALVMYDMDVQKNTGKELQSQTKVNQRQDKVDVQLRDVNRTQSKKISTLDQENDNLTAELDRLSQELDAMQAQTGAEPERKKDSDSDSKTEPSTANVNVRADDRAEKKQQRDTDTEKRADDRAEKKQQRDTDTEKQADDRADKKQRDTDTEKSKQEPARLRPGSNTFKPLGSTLPMVKPAVVPAMPTIDVIDEPATSPAIRQMAQQLANPSKPQQDTELPASFGGAQDQTQADLPGEPEPPMVDQPLPQTVDAEEEPRLPDNVSSLDQARRVRDQLRQTTAQQARDTIRDFKTGTMESQELRRMRELAGLRVNEADSFYTPSAPGVFAIRVNEMFIDDYSPSYRPENPEILWNGLSTAFPRDYPRVKFNTPNTPQADVFATLKDRSVADVKTGLTQDMAETLVDRLGKSDPTGQLGRFIELIKKRA